MRVTNQMMNTMLASSIQENQQAVYAQEQRISSGKQISRAADDPAAWAKAAQLEREKNQLQGYMDAADEAAFELRALDQSLETISDILSSASEAAVKGSDATLAATDRTALGQQVDEMLEQLVHASNSSFNGQYQFAGVQTQTEPFGVTRDADGRIDSVAYAGAAFAGSVNVAEGDRVPKQLVGDDADNGLLISSNGDAFAALIALRDELLGNNNVAESGLQNQIDSVRENVIVGRASVGAYIEHTEFVGDMHAAKEMSLSESISAIEDIDVAEAVTDLAAKQTAYEAALSMASKTLNMSLLQYM